MNKPMIVFGMLLAVMLAVVCVNAGAKALVPFGVLEQQPYEGKFFYATNASGDAPGDDWMNSEFNDYDWGTVTLPIVNGTLSYSNTTWSIENTTYWVRCHFTPTADDLTKFLYLYIANDYTCEAYINGVRVYNVTAAANYNIIAVSDEAKAALKAGQDNVLAVKVSDTNGGTRYMDFGLYASDFQDAVARADVPVTFVNDADNPWTVEGYTIMKRGTGVGNYYTATWLKMNYTSTYRTELSFDWASYDNYAHDGLQLYVDGVQVSSLYNNSSYQSKRFIIEPGEHAIAFRDSSNREDRVANWSGIKNLKVKEIRPLETILLTEKSQPLHFENNDADPWILEDGYIENSNYSIANTSTELSTSFTIDKTSKLMFDYLCYCANDNRYGDYAGYQNLKVYINGVNVNNYWGIGEYRTFCATLEPGDYTIVVKDSVTNNHLYYSRIKNFELSTNWINVELATPGTLGYEALYTPGIDVLNDVEFIKVKGKMNDADWADIKNMQNLKALDLSEAVTGAVPDNAFDGLTFLGSVILPETATTIGQYAFRNTTIRRINIPAAVTEIKQYAFQSTPLMYCTFSEGSQLKTIGDNAFQSCTLLQEIDLPALLETFGFRVFDACSGIKRVTMGDAVTNIGRYTFYNCKELESVRLSDAIETIYCDLCRENWALTEVHLPANLKIMERGAFYNTKSLRSIEFPDGLERIEYDAFNYSALDSVKLPLNLYSLGSNAFSNNSNLKYIEFPSYITDDSYWYWSSDRYGYDATSASGYRSNFQACPNIEKIVMRSATPPTVAADPFAGSRDKTVITLVVPSFAVVNYKLDTYWKQFGSIIEGDDVDYWKITSPLMLTNNLRMQGKPDVDLYYNGQLTVGGAAPMTMQNFNMFFSEDNPGRLLNTCDDMTADNITTRFSVAANRWYFITPVHDVNLSDVAVTNAASYVFRYYDAASRAANGTTGNNSWKNVDTGKLLAGQGYIFQCNRECMITLPAGENGGAQLFTTNDVTTNLATNEATVTANRSWNYVGNPYPCYYDIYYMDFTAPITVWTGSTYKAYSIADDEFVLRPMQSFFVQKPDAVDKIVFKKEGRQLLSTISSHVAAGAKGSAPQANAVGARSVYDIVIAKANENEDCDQMRVVLNENANMGYEVECDASKFMSMNTGVPQIMTTDADGNHYAINERPVQNGTVTIGYYTGEPGEHVISLKRGEGTVTLTDNETGETTDLAKQAYTFHTNETDGVNTTRFTVTFGSAATSIIGLDSVETDNETATYDLLGRRVNVVKQGIYIQHSPEGRLQGKNGRKVVK